MPTNLITCPEARAGSGLLTVTDAVQADHRKKQPIGSSLFWVFCVTTTKTQWGDRCLAQGLTKVRTGCLEGQDREAGQVLTAVLILLRGGWVRSCTSLAQAVGQDDVPLPGRGLPRLTALPE